MDIKKINSEHRTFINSLKKGTKNCYLSQLPKLTKERTLTLGKVLWNKAKKSPIKKVSLIEKKSIFIKYRM